MTNTDVSREVTPPKPTRHAEPPHAREASLRERDTVQRAQSGDRAALEILLASARPRLYAVALKMVRDHDAAEDVVQDALLKVWRHVDRFEQRAALGTWLHRIVVNTALDHLRARRGRPEVDAARDAGDDRTTPIEDRVQAERVSADNPEEALARAQTGQVVRAAMGRLVPLHREVIVLRELDGEPYQSIAEIARCPVGTVMSRLHHARHRLAEALGSCAPDLLPQAA